MVALDAERHWYQYHQLFAELLREELQRGDPDRFGTLNQRATDWFEARGEPDAAVRHAVAAGDRDRAGDLILTHAMALTSRGRNATVGLWLDTIDEKWLREVPALAFAGALYADATADMGALEQHLDAARRLRDSGPLADGTPSLTVGVAIVTAMAGRFGVEDMARYTEVVRRAGREANPWWPVATGLQGVAEVLLGNVESGTTLSRTRWTTCASSSLAHRGPCLASRCRAGAGGSRPRRGPRGGRVVRRGDQRDREPADGPVGVVGRSQSRGARRRPWTGRDPCRNERGSSSRPSVTSAGFSSRLELMAPLCLAEAFVAVGDGSVAREMCVRANLCVCPRAQRHTRPPSPRSSRHRADPTRRRSPCRSVADCRRAPCVGASPDARVVAADRRSAVRLPKHS